MVDVSTEERDPHTGRWVEGEHNEKLTKNKLLSEETPASQPNSRSKFEVADELNARGQAALKEAGIESGKVEYDRRTPTDPKVLDMIATQIAHEIAADVARAGKSAKDWYTEKLQSAMRIASLMYGEIGSKDEFKAMNAKLGLTLGMAITSQGERVSNNTVLADKVYQYYRDHGRFPTDVKAQNAGIINKSFERANLMLDHLGVKGTVEFLNKEFEVRDLQKMGFKISGEMKGTKVYGSAVFGPKVGQGFYQNLNGNYKPLTMDMWFMRAWGRLTGTLVAHVDPAGPRDRFEAAMKSPNPADKDFTDRIRDILAKPTKNDEELLAKAEAIGKAHDKYFEEHREQYDKGEIDKPRIAATAERFVDAKHGLNDQPGSGGKRQWMRDVFTQAQQKLDAMGVHLTIADMQATWWYPEKDLYGKMGARTTHLNSDYADEFAKLAESKGIAKDRIENAR